MEREPLPYPHERQPHDPGNRWACTIAEGEYVEWRSTSDECLGCRASIAYLTVHHPHAAAVTRDNRRSTNLDAFREEVPDYDPIRVLLERHLANRRGES